MSKIDDLKAAMDTESLDIRHVADAVAASAASVAVLIAAAKSANDPSLQVFIDTLTQHHTDLTAIADAASKIVPAS